MKKHRWALLTAVAALLIVGVFGITRVIDNRGTQKRQIEYETVLKDYSDALHSGATRRDVESYLNLKGRPFRQMCCVKVPRSADADLVKIGSEKAPWYCNKYNIYVAFEFETTEPHGIVADTRDSDKLVSTGLFPWLEECL